MANIQSYRCVYHDEVGLVGLFTNKKAAEEAAASVPGSVLHVLPANLLNQTVAVTGYTPPSPPVLSYGEPTDQYVLEEKYPDLALAQEQEYQADEDYEYVSQTHTVAPPKVLTAKDLILARLARDLGVEDESADDDPAAPVKAPAPSGGTAVFREGGTGPGSTAASVEYFSPI